MHLLICTPIRIRMLYAVFLYTSLSPVQILILLLLFTNILINTNINTPSARYVIAIFRNSRAFFVFRLETGDLRSGSTSTWFVLKCQSVQILSTPSTNLHCLTYFESTFSMTSSLITLLQIFSKYFWCMSIGLFWAYMLWQAQSVTETTIDHQPYQKLLSHSVLAVCVVCNHVLAFFTDSSFHYLATQMYDRYLSCHRSHAAKRKHTIKYLAFDLRSGGDVHAE